MIRSDEYRIAAENMANDPIVIEMAGELPDYVDFSTLPANVFLHEYHARGGKGEGFIGTVKEAIGLIRSK